MREIGRSRPDLPSHAALEDPFPDPNANFDHQCRWPLDPDTQAGRSAIGAALRPLHLGAEGYEGSSCVRFGSTC